MLSYRAYGTTNCQSHIAPNLREKGPISSDPFESAGCYLDVVSMAFLHILATPESVIIH